MQVEELVSNLITHTALEHYTHWESNPYFSEKEFACPCCGKCEMDYEFIHLLTYIRKTWTSVPMNINSGYRCEKHNEAVGGSKTSSHLKGVAADISCTDSSARWEIVQGLIKEMSRIGIAKTFIHVDLDDTKPEALWTY